MKSYRFRALLVLVMATTAFAQDLRDQRSLDGPWRRLVTMDSRLEVPKAGLSESRVPSTVFSAAKGGSQFAWYVRDVAIPAAWRGKRVFVRLGGARYHPHVFVDGKLVAERLDGWTPFEVEITSHVAAGKTHELAVRCQDWGATFTKGFTLPKVTSKDPRDDAKGHVLAPIGGHFAFFGMWDSAALVARPKTYLDDVAIVTSVRKMRLTVSGLCLAGSEGMGVEAKVLDGGRVALRLPPAMVVRSGKWSASARFDKPRMWSPEDPHLYMLELTLRAGNGRVLDVRRERFGFRELWAEGPDFYLNGVKRHLLATSTWPDSGPVSRKEVREILKTIRAGHNVAFRMHTQPWQEIYLDEADEVGLMMVEEAALWTRSCFKYSDPRFWQNYKDHLAGMIRRDRNHACLAMWSMENELLHCGAARIYPKAEEKLADIGRFAKALDPHHLITFESDHDPGGAADVIGLHYPHEMPAHADYPNTADWLDKTVVTGTAGGIGGSWNRKFHWSRKKPLYIGEFLWVPTDDYAPGTVFYGDDSYLDHGRYKLMAKADAWTYQVLAYRRAGVSGMCPWTCTGRGGRVDPNRSLLYDTQAKVYEPLAAFVREQDSRFFAGEAVKRTMDVFNDTPQRQTLLLKWSLGRVEGRKELALDPAGYQPVQIELRMPQADTRRKLEFRTALHVAGKRVHEQSHSYSVEPRLPIAAPKGVSLAVYDPQRGLPASFGQRQLETLDELASCDPTATLCIVGPGALVAPKVSEIPVVGAKVSGVGVLTDFLRRGGRALILAQKTFAGLPLNVELVRHASTMTFPVAPHHPVLAGMEPGDLKFWREGHYVSRLEMRRPTRGGARPILVSGGDDSVAQGPLMEVPAGRGTALLCQALVAEKLNTEPAARRLFQNMLDYLAELRPRQAKTLLVCESDAFAKRLAGLGLAFVRIPGALTEAQARACDVLVLHGGGQSITNSRRAIQAFMSSGRPGCALYWHAPDAETFAQIRNAIGCAGMEVVPANGPISMKARQHELLRGICREDLVYVGKPRGRAWARGFEPDPSVVDRAFMPTAGDVASAQRFEAEKMQIEGKITRVDKTGVYFATRGSAMAKVRIAKPGTYRLTILAGGTPAAGVYPVAAVRVDGKAVARVALMQGKTRPYVAMADLPAGAHDLSVAFVNDAQIGGEDRNMFLDAVLLDREPLAKTEVEFLTLPTSLATRTTRRVRVILDGIRWDTNARNRIKGSRYASALLGNLGCSFVLPKGDVSWITAQSFEPVGTIPYFRKTQSEVSLVAAGTIKAQFRCAQAGTYRVLVRGRSQPALGEYAKAQVRVDGRRVGEPGIAATAVDVFPAGEVQLEPGMHEVTLEFTNDIYRDGQDRNLYVAAVGFAR